MGVDVDEAGRDEPALRVDLFRALAGNLADSGDPAVLHRDVAFADRRARAIGDIAAANDEIEVSHQLLPPKKCIRNRRNTGKRYM